MTLLQSIICYPQLNKRRLLEDEESGKCESRLCSIWWRIHLELLLTGSYFLLFYCSIRVHAQLSIIFTSSTTQRLTQQHPGSLVISQQHCFWHLFQPSTKSPLETTLLKTSNACNGKHNSVGGTLVTLSHKPVHAPNWACSYFVSIVCALVAWERRAFSDQASLTCSVRPLFVILLGVMC